MGYILDFFAHEHLLIFFFLITISKTQRKNVFL
jgi:hypothetical protein